MLKAARSLEQRGWEGLLARPAPGVLAQLFLGSSYLPEQEQHRPGSGFQVWESVSQSSSCHHGAQGWAHGRDQEFWIPLGAGAGSAETAHFTGSQGQGMLLAGALSLRTIALDHRVLECVNHGDQGSWSCHASLLA